MTGPATRGTSLRRRLLDFLRANDGEHLTVRDATIKFNAEGRHVRAVASRMRKFGELGPGPEMRLP
jgi:hypothetical protein